MRLLSFLLAFLCVINYILLTTSFIQRQMSDAAAEDDDLQQLLQRLSEEDRQAVHAIIQLDCIDKMEKCRFRRQAPSYVGETVKYMLETVQKNLSNNDKKIIQSAIIRAIQDAGAFNCASLYRENQHLWTGF